jgi:hypothetical protein
MSCLRLVLSLPKGGGSLFVHFIYKIILFISTTPPLPSFYLLTWNTFGGIHFPKEREKQDIRYKQELNNLGGEYYVDVVIV